MARLLGRGFRKRPRRDNITILILALLLLSAARAAFSCKVVSPPRACPRIHASARWGAAPSQMGQAGGAIGGCA
eukprot:8751734-Pyramimonas_sp.AAC.1